MMEIPRPRILAATGTALGAFVIYMVTLAPSLDFIDAGELSAVAHSFGIAHPTGYPLFTVLAGMWAWLPVGDGIFRMNVFAALCAAIGVGFYVDAIREILGLQYAGKKISKKVQRASGVDSAHIIASILGGVAIALSRTYWRTALSIEVYALHMLTLALVLWAASRVLTAMHDMTLGSTLRGRVILLALFLGLSFSNHMSTVFVLPAMLLLLVVLLLRKLMDVRAVLASAGAFAAGLLPYLYLPIRAGSDPWLNWGNPETWERFIWHITGKQYSVWMFSSADAWKKQFGTISAMLPTDVQYLALAAALIGAVVVFRWNKLAGSILLLLFVTCIVWAAGYDIHDIDSYLLLAFVVIGFWSAAGIVATTQWLVRSMSLNLAHPTALGAVFVFPMLLNFTTVSQHENYLVEDYTRSMFASLEKNALVISYQWDYWVSASLYYQSVEKFRTDVIVLDKELFRRSWYIEQLRVNYPELYRRSRAEIAAFGSELTKFEHDIPYDPAAIEHAFNRMVNSFIEKNYEERPVYVTIELEEQFAPGFVRVPVGLAFRLYRPEHVPPPKDLPFPDIQYRPFESEERLPVALRGMYGSMLMNRGTYMHRAGLFSEAAPYFDRALEFVPDDTRMLQMKQRNDESLRLGQQPGTE